jgi:hypothetical protein
LDKKELLKKLRIKPDMKYAVFNKPADFPGLLGKDAHIKNQKGKYFDALVLFVYSSEDLLAYLKKILPVISPATIFWISYPKKTSGITSDLNRNILWQSMSKYGYRAVSQISLDTRWSALWFKPRDKVISKIISTPSVDLINRKVKIPQELKPIFRKNKKAEEFFKSLSFTHKKEYIIWIESAKKTESRTARIAKTVEMLNERIKSR